MPNYVEYDDDGKQKVMHVDHPREDMEIAINSALQANENGPHYEIRKNWEGNVYGVRIYTRDSQRPELNANGGDYDYWTFFGVGRDGHAYSIEDWSADFYYNDWNHAQMDTYHEITVGALVSQIEQQAGWIKMAREHGDK